MSLWAGLHFLAADVALAAQPENEEEPAPPLKARVAGPGTADGRTVVRVRVRGTASGAMWQPAFGENPWVACPNAATFSSKGKSGPGILVPASRKSAVQECTVHVKKRSTTLEVSSRRPGPGIYVEVGNPQPFVGDAPVQLEPFVVTKDGEIRTPTSLTIATSGGEIETLESGELLLHLPPDKAPWPLAVVFTDGEQIGAAFIPMVARVRLPVKTEKNAQVELDVAGRVFGPQLAKSQELRMTIEVPAGETQALLHATDIVGNVTNTTVDLQTPARPRIAVVAARQSSRVGSITQLVVAVAGPDGAPASASEAPSAEAARGKASKSIASGPGLWRIPYQAPKTPGEDHVTVRVSDSSTAGEAKVTLLIRVGVPKKIEIVPPKNRLGPEQVASVAVTVRDRFDNVVPGPKVVALLDGKTQGVVVSDDAKALTVALPKRLPTGGVISLDVEAGKARKTVSLSTRKLPSAA